MAEIAASILGIASFGIGLTRTLYEFGSTVSGTKEHTDYIARHVTLYASVLELLCDRINDEQPILSEKAYELVEELSGQSEELFHKIRNSLPNRGRDDVTFFQKIKWNFKKGKVDLLVAELDYLKSTVHLLVTVLFAGKGIRSYRRKRHTRADGSLHHEYANVQFQSMKAQNAIIDQLNATDKLHDLQHEDEPDVPLLVSDTARDAKPINCSDLVSQHQDIIPKLEHYFKSIEDPSERQALVLQDSAPILHSLLQEWTTLEPEQNDASSATSSFDQSSRFDDRSSQLDPYAQGRLSQVEQLGITKPATDIPPAARSPMPTELPFPGFAASQSASPHQSAQSYHRDWPYSGHTRAFDDASDQARDTYGNNQQRDAQSATPNFEARKPTRLSERSATTNTSPGASYEDSNITGRDSAQGYTRADDYEKNSKRKKRTSLADRPVVSEIWTACPWPDCRIEASTELAMENHIRKGHNDRWPNKANKLPRPEMPPKGILRRATVQFPESPDFVREGVAPLNDLKAEGVPPSARWTKISRDRVSPQALEEARERFEEVDDSVVVLRVVPRQEMQKLIKRTSEIRGMEHDLLDPHLHILTSHAHIEEARSWQREMDLRSKTRAGKKTAKRNEVAGKDKSRKQAYVQDDTDSG
ncbi:MAG: hypothetical protein Q9227_003350 [Pyrenula ochraceoflavens]